MSRMWCRCDVQVCSSCCWVRLAAPATQLTRALHEQDVVQVAGAVQAHTHAHKLALVRDAVRDDVRVAGVHVGGTLRGSNGHSNSDVTGRSCKHTCLGFAASASVGKSGVKTSDV
jgi:hypothetical protein